jgi:hypothetical protein
MGTVNSSEATRARAAALAKEAGCFSIDRTLKLLIVLILIHRLARTTLISTLMEL